MTNEEILDNFELKALKYKDKSQKKTLKMGLFITMLIAIIYFFMITQINSIIPIIILLYFFIWMFIEGILMILPKKYFKKRGSRTKLVLSHTNFTSHDLEMILGQLGYKKIQYQNEYVYYGKKSIRMGVSHRYLNYRINGNYIEFEMWALNKNKEISIDSNSYFGYDVWFALAYDLRVINNEINKVGGPNE